MKIGVAILTLNAGEAFKTLLDSLAKQDCAIERMLVADSGSQDGTVELAKQYHCEILTIPKGKFNHGTTRKQCVQHLQGMDVIVFLTQDVILQGFSALKQLTEVFQDETIAVSYGRQIPFLDASPLAAQNRAFNYTEESLIKAFEDRQWLGIKTPFTSDSFAAYRTRALEEVGSFPHVIVSEDMYVAAKLLVAGYKVAYRAEACVYHSHDYTLKQELQRYFDIGVFMGREPWIREIFGGAEGEGLKLVKNQLAYLYKHHGISSIPKAIAVNVVKLIGYRLGIYESYLPLWLTKQLSGQRYFFNQRRKR